MAAPRILIVDDNRDLAENVAEILESNGYAPTLFDKPQAALDAFVPGVYALALLDVCMPRIDGVELHRRLAQQDRALLAVCMTAHARNEAIRTLLEEGVALVVYKSGAWSEVTARLQTLIKGPRVLVVDDDVPLATKLVESLVDAGYAARHCSTVERALELTRLWQPAGVVVDARLPDGRGDALVRSLPPETKFVLTSAWPLESLEGISAASVMSKPLDLARMCSMLGHPL